MVNIEKVLFPTDFSVNSDFVLEYAMSLSKKYGARMYILHVVDETIDIAEFYVPHMRIDKIDKEMLDGAEKIMDDFCKKHLCGFNDFETIIRFGLPHAEILKSADENGVDAIVMGTHGRTGINRVFFGSVAEKVVKKSSRPVLTVKMPE